MRELLNSLKNRTTDSEVLSNYKETGSITAAVFVRMGIYTIQLDSQMQTISNECVTRHIGNKTKMPLQEYIQTVDSEFVKNMNTAS